MIKINKTAINKLTKVLLQKKIGTIPTKQTRKIWSVDKVEYVDAPIHWVPIKHIVRSDDHAGYVAMRAGKPNPRRIVDYGAEEHDKDMVNSIRKAIRAGKYYELPPIYLRRVTHKDKVFNSYLKPHHKFVIMDGHHRLTAHQAEGKKFIRAVIAE